LNGEGNDTQPVELDLLDRIGGDPAAALIADGIWERVLAHTAMRIRFNGLDADAARARLRTFLERALHDPSRNEHAAPARGAILDGMEIHDFDRMVEFAAETLEELGTDEGLIDHVRVLLAPYRLDFDECRNEGTTSKDDKGSEFMANETLQGDTGVEHMDAADALSSLTGVQGALDACQSNVLIANADLTVVYANAIALKTLQGIDHEIRSAFGIGAGQIVGGPIHRFHQDPQSVEQILRNRAALPHETEFTFGNVTLRATINGIYDGTGATTGYIVNWDDVTERIRLEAQQRESAENAEATNRVLTALDSAATVDEAAKAALDRVREAFGWAYGSFWTIDPEVNALTFNVESGDAGPEFRQVTLSAQFPKGVGLAGKVWERRELVFVEDIGDMTDCCRAPVAKRVGVQSGVSFPILKNGDVFGTMDFFATETLAPSEERLEALRNIGQLVSKAIERVGIAEEQSRIQAMVENAPVNVMMADLDLNIIYANPA